MIFDESLSKLALFNKLEISIAEQEVLDKYINSITHTSDSDYKFNTYPPIYKTWSLRCIKTNYPSPQRLFFLTHNSSNAFIILINIEVGAGQHSRLHHWQAIMRVINRLEKSYHVDLSSYQADKSTSLKTLGDNPTKKTPVVEKSSPISKERLQQIIETYRENSLSRRIIIEIINSYIEVYNYEPETSLQTGIRLFNTSIQDLSNKLFECILDIICRTDCSLILIKQGKSLYCDTRLGETLCRQELTTPTGDFNQFVQNHIIEPLQKCIVQNSQHAESIYKFILLSISICPHQISSLLVKLKGISFNKNRNWVKYFVMQINHLLSTGVIDQEEYAKFLIFLHQQELLILLPTELIPEIVASIIELCNAEKVLDQNQINFHDLHNEIYPYLPEIMSSIFNLMDLTHFQKLLTHHSLQLSDKKINLIFEYLLLTRPLDQVVFLSLLTFKTYPAFNDDVLLQTLYSLYIDSTEDIKTLCQAHFVNFISVLERFKIFPFLPSTQSMPSEKTHNKRHSPPQNLTKKVTPKTTTSDNFLVPLTSVSNPARFITHLKMQLKPYIQNGEIHFSEPKKEKSFIELLKKNKLDENMSVIEAAILIGDFTLTKSLCIFYRKTELKPLFEKHTKMALSLAVKHLHAEILQLLISSFSFDPNTPAKGVHIIYSAFKSKNRNDPDNKKLKQVLTVLFDSGVNPNQTKGAPLLIIVLYHKYPHDVVEFLLKKGTDPNALYRNDFHLVTVLDCLRSLPKYDKKIENTLLKYGGKISEGVTLFAAEDDLPHDINYAHEELALLPLTKCSLHIQKIVEQMMHILIKYQQNELSSTEMINYIRQEKIAPNTKLFTSRITVLHVAFRQKDKMLIKWLLETCEIHIDCAVTFSDSAIVSAYPGNYLHQAIFYDMYDFIPTLLDMGCPMDAVDHIGHTPLQLAIKYGKYEAVLELLKCGFKPFEPQLKHNGNKITLLEFCKIMGNIDIIRLICSFQKNPKYQPDPAFILRQKVIAGDIDSVTKLMKLDFDINSVNDEGNTAIYLACNLRRLTDYAIIEKLLENPATNPGIINKNGYQALQVFYAAHNDGYFFSNPSKISDPQIKEKYLAIASLIANRIIAHIDKSSHGMKNSDSVFFKCDGTYSIAPKAEVDKMKEEDLKKGFIVRK